MLDPFTVVDGTYLGDGKSEVLSEGEPDPLLIFLQRHQLLLGQAAITTQVLVYVPYINAI
jgi:hypothetical protein